MARTFSDGRFPSDARNQSIGLVARRPADNDIDTAIERLAQPLERSAPHDERLAHRLALEPAEVRG